MYPASPHEGKAMIGEKSRLHEQIFDLRTIIQRGQSRKFLIPLYLGILLIDSFVHREFVRIHDREESANTIVGCRYRIPSIKFRIKYFRRTFD